MCGVESAYQRHLSPGPSGGSRAVGSSCKGAQPELGRNAQVKKPPAAKNLSSPLSTRKELRHRISLVNAEVIGPLVAKVGAAQPIPVRVERSPRLTRAS